jgi:hypothetical protein
MDFLHMWDHSNLGSALHVWGIGVAGIPGHLWDVTGICWAYFFMAIRREIMPT